ncbi:hypothetical protein D3C87_1870970 [compost metagenome]
MKKMRWPRAPSILVSETISKLPSACTVSFSPSLSSAVSPALKAVGSRLEKPKAETSPAAEPSSTSPEITNLPSRSTWASAPGARATMFWVEVDSAVHQPETAS